MASIARARNLRQTQTYAEAALWEILRAGRLNGWKFRRQHPIGRYVADFACPQARLVIELDGGVHREEEQELRDLLRTEVIERFGWHVLRFTNDEILSDPSPAPAEILRMCQVGGVGDPHPPTRFARGSLPLPRGEG